MCLRKCIEKRYTKTHYNVNGEEYDVDEGGTGGRSGPSYRAMTPMEKKRQKTEEKRKKKKEKGMSKE